MPAVVGATMAANMRWPRTVRPCLWLAFLAANTSCDRAREHKPAPAAADEPLSQTGVSRAHAICPPVAAPKTAPGRRLEHFQRAVATSNPTDLSSLERFVNEEMSAEFLAMVPPAQHVQVLSSLPHGGDEGLTLCRLESSADDEVVAILGGFDPGGALRYVRLHIEVEEGEGKVASIRIEPASSDDLTRAIEPMGPAEVAAVVDGVAGELERYVYADKAQAMKAKILEAAQAGDYAGVTQRRLAKLLTRDLLEVSGDRHLRVMYNPAGIPPQASDRTLGPEELEKRKTHAAANNFGMPVAQARKGNIGYLNVRGFLPPELAADAVAETMTQLANTDALIIDLRQNNGGSPHGVALMASYLFGSKPVHLNDIYNRSENSTESFYTQKRVAGRRFGPDKPVFVLTSARTFSAGEGFAYNLKAQKRVTLVGETTGGGAHPTHVVRISNNWAIALPTARAINPVTKTNWEGVGVTPDVEVPADEALDKALELVAAL